MKLIDPTVQFLDGDSDHQLVIKHTQDIPDSFLERLRAARLETAHRPMGDFHRFASIPVAVVEKWKREGFDIMHESPKAIIRKLQAEDLSAFITTTKEL